MDTLYDEYYDGPAESSETLHKRLIALRQLLAHGIPCILWGEDALAFAHSVPTQLFDQQILVPDVLLNTAAAALEEKYRPTSEPNRSYLVRQGPHKGDYAFPKSVRLEHLAMLESEPYQLYPTPRNILLLPQSYFGLDATALSRFQSLVPPLDASNADILVPKYHTFLEGLVHFIMYPPSGRWDSLRSYDNFIDYLLHYRIRGDSYVKQEIYSEIQTEDCAWFMYLTLFRQKGVHTREIEEYKRLKELRNRNPSETNLVMGSTAPYYTGSINFGHPTIREYSTFPTLRPQPRLDILRHHTYRSLSSGGFTRTGSSILHTFSVIRRLIRR